MPVTVGVVPALVPEVVVVVATHAPFCNLALAQQGLPPVSAKLTPAGVQPRPVVVVGVLVADPKSQQNRPEEHVPETEIPKPSRHSNRDGTQVFVHAGYGPAALPRRSASWPCWEMKKAAKGSVAKKNNSTARRRNLFPCFFLIAGGTTGIGSGSKGTSSVFVGFPSIA